ncbi:helix-turn-helix transcriptional regulator [Bacillus sp. MM2020_4]|uniref:helix-turn-helix domain-containing protein n=1 Tax=Bacillus sp. MM2020_4 TaxID=2714039 RepID=UPI001A97D77D
MPTNLKRLREAKGIQQQDMAKRLGYTVQSYNRVENGKRKLPIAKAMKAAEILGCSMDEIFFNQ